MERRRHPVRRSNPRRLIAAFVVFLAWSGAAHAQDIIFNNSVGLATGNIQSFTTTQTLLNTIEPNDALGYRPKGTGLGALFGARRASAGAIQTAYAASPDVSRRVQSQFLDWARSVDGTDADRLEQAMARYDFVDIYKGIVRGFGLGADDAADAYTAYWVLNWMMANGSGDPSRSDVMAARSQVDQSLATNATFAGFSEAERQEMAEVFIYNFVVQHGAYFGAIQRGQTGLVRQLSDAAQVRFANEMGVDLRGMSLTSLGFRKKG